MRYQLTADGKKRVGLLAFCCRHTFQSTEPSPANVDPTLHLRLPKHGTQQCDSYDIALFLGGIHLLGTPKGGRLHFVDKRLMGSQAIHQLSLFGTLRNPSLKSVQKTHIPSSLGFENSCVTASNLTSCHLENHRHMPSHFSTLPAVSLGRGHWKNSEPPLCSLNKGEMFNSSQGLHIAQHRTVKITAATSALSGHRLNTGRSTMCFRTYVCVPACNEY